jgi:hypothetical protein
LNFFFSAIGQSLSNAAYILARLLSDSPLRLTVAFPLGSTLTSGLLACGSGGLAGLLALTALGSASILTLTARGAASILTLSACSTSLVLTLPLCCQYLCSVI